MVKRWNVDKETVFSFSEGKMGLWCETSAPGHTRTLAHRLDRFRTHETIRQRLAKPREDMVCIYSPSPWGAYLVRYRLYRTPFPTAIAFCLLVLISYHNLIQTITAPLVLSY